MKLTARLTDEELEQARDYARGSLRMTAIIAELKERRAADLSEQDVEALRQLRRCAAHHWCETEDEHVAALSVLDRLLGGRGR